MQKVLVVDDEESIRHMLSLVLKKAGYAVKTAGHGQEALQELLVRSYDLVLCDLKMPVMSGQDLLREVITRKLPTTMIMMSAYGDRDTALEAIKLGAYDYIPKPFRKDEILLTLQKVEERERLKEENTRLRKAQKDSQQFHNIIARSPAMEKIFHTVRKVAAFRTTVLIGGESGTGKELIARAIHANSPRKDKAWVPINCGAIPEALLESELFGHVRGAFTDAKSNKEGLFQKAHGGTLFLDEVAELPLSLQVKLLRVLQEDEVRPVGATRNISVNVRIVAATARNLEEMVRDGSFREDLFFRLNVLSIKLPALRERPEDIPLLIQHFIERNNVRLGTKIQDISPEALKLMVDYPWNGNIRELENAIEVAIVLSEGDIIQPDALPPRFHDEHNVIRRVLQGSSLSIKKATRELERILIRRALEKTHGNRTKASELLEISPRALQYKIKDYDLTEVS